MIDIPLEKRKIIARLMAEQGFEILPDEVPSMLKDIIDRTRDRMVTAGHTAFETLSDEQIYDILIQAVENGHQT